MSDLIIEFSAIMRAELETLNAIAQNSANVNTTGYRAQRTVRTETDFANLLVDSNQSLITAYSNANGSSKLTGKSTDVAILGEGWFVVNHPSGTMLTRNGNFEIDADGKLITQMGYEVLGETGSIEGLDKSMSIAADGTIFVKGESVEKLRIVKESDINNISAIGDGLYTARGALSEAQEYKLVQGALEQSNVDMAADMVRLIETTRHIESLQRAMSAYDDLLKTGISEIGK